MSRIRWVLILPVSIVSWYLVFTIGMALLGVAANLCSEKLMINGSCSAPWYTTAKDVLIIVLAGLSAVNVVLAAYLVAPAHKTSAAIVAFIIGAAAATYVVIDTGSWLEYGAAITGGLLTTLLVARRNHVSANALD